MNKTLLISSCQRGDRKAQKELYDHYKQKMFMLCLRYMRSRADAMDAMQEGFIKIFKDLHQYDSNRGSLEAWMNRVFVNTNLELIRKRRMKIVDLNDVHTADYHTEPSAYNNLGQEEIVKLIQGLPDGYRTVFNLYVIEGYSHKEIAEMLDISLSTSKSQLFKAKRALKEQIETALTA